VSVRRLDEAPDPNAGSVGYRLVAVLALFTAHVALALGVATLDCRRGYFAGSLAGFPTSRALLLGLTVAAALASVWIALGAILELRREGGIASAVSAPQDTRRFSLLIIAGAAAFLSPHLVWSAIAITTVDVC
jgi:hypothetical protein